MHFKTETVTWQDFIARMLDVQQEWLFRGEQERTGGDWKENFKTSLDRVFESWKGAIAHLDRRVVERELIRDFQRRFTQASESRPSKDDMLTWLALMQHYGAPTRLLDWTYSPFIAAFFAFRGLLERPEKSSCVIWAIRRSWFDERLEELLTSREIRGIARVRNNDPDAFESIFMGRANRAFAYPVIPFELNERIILQQGVFLCPADVSKNFPENFTALLKERTYPGSVIKFQFRDITRPTLKQVLIDLHRMNIYDSSLFPGIEGYARSFTTRLPLIYEMLSTR